MTSPADSVRKEAERLREEFEGSFNAETIMLLVNETYALLAKSARIDAYLPLLTYRFARERLLAQARVRGMTRDRNPEVLFVCVHNAGRSQMAAALTASLSSGRVHVRSAGSAPTGTINPRVVEAMAEVGIDLAEEFPKPLTDDVVEASDVVITMGCGDACPVFPGKRYLDWVVDDPAGQPIEVVRRIRDDIRARVVALLDELGTGGEPNG
jgi:protein-tyrosine-phosphatase